MSYNAGLGISYENALADARERYAKYGQYSAQNQGSATNAVSLNGPQTDVYQSGISDAGFFENTCTDGKDDGKIGFFSAIGNAIEGVGKGIVNGVKGMFTNKDGKFSLGKTLLSVGAAAVCIAFPAVGAVACGVGAVMGGVQVAKGASAAMNAKTDAEAKAAWENMGEGGATVVGCVVGAKASVGAMKGASTAAIDDAIKGLDNVDDVAKALKGIDKTNIDDVAAALNKAGIDNVDDVTKAISSVGENTSALSQVDDSLKGLDAMKAKGKAFYKDAVSSSKNNGGKIWTKVKEVKTNADDYTELKNLKKDHAEALKKQEAGQELTQKDIEILDKWDNPETFKKYSDKNLDKLAKQNADDFYKAEKAALKDAKKVAKKANDQAALKKADDALKALEADYSNNGKFRQLTSSAKEAMSNTKTGNYLKQALSQDEQASVLKNIKNIKLKDLGGALSKDGQAILSFLQSGEGTYAQAVQQFGYDNVAQVLKVAFAYGQTNSIV